MPAAVDPLADDRLDSWKEIAAYLGREVRTVQGWEKGEGLPVHRHQHARQGSVYAFKSELDVWREGRRGSPEIPPDLTREPAPVAPPGRRLALALALSICIAAGAGLAVVGWMRWHGRTSGEMPSSVVVLPFLDLSAGKDQEYFSDGLTEELIDALTRLPGLRVVARTSAFAFKGKAVDIRQIGQQLNVGAVLEGSVRKSGDQLRITAQLARVSDGYHLWSRTYDRGLRDVFAVQREIAQAIADQLQAGTVPHREPARDLEAYRLYEEGLYFLNQFQAPESNRKAIQRFEQAIERDPKFAPAYAGIADSYAYLAETFVSAPKDVMPQAKDAAEKALALDDSSAEAHTSLGIVKLDYERDRDGAQREFLRAMQLNPGSGYAHHWYAHSLEAQDRAEEALKAMRAALDLDPLSIPIHWDIGNELLCLGRYDDALRHLQKANELFPQVPLISFMIVEAYLGKQDTGSAHRTLDAMKRAQPELAKDPIFMGTFGADAARQGRTAEARETLNQLERLHQNQYIEPFMVIELCLALHDAKQTALWLNRADEERSTLFVYMPMMTRFSRLDTSLTAQHVTRPR